jgi:hypothetical protein
MSKYAPLGRHLAAQPSREILLAFSEIERLLGDSLPASAHNHRAWWANERSGPIRKPMRGSGPAGVSTR